MSESVVGQGFCMARSLWVKLDCLNPNLDRCKGSPIGRTLETDVMRCIGMNRGLIHSLRMRKDQRGLTKR
jgi:hypothetical protein